MLLDSTDLCWAADHSLAWKTVPPTTFVPTLRVLTLWQLKPKQMKQKTSALFLSHPKPCGWNEGWFVGLRTFFQCYGFGCLCAEYPEAGDDRGEWQQESGSVDPHPSVPTVHSHHCWVQCLPCKWRYTLLCGCGGGGGGGGSRSAIELIVFPNLCRHCFIVVTAEYAS